MWIDISAAELRVESKLSHDRLWDIEKTLYHHPNKSVKYCDKAGDLQP